MKLSYFFIITSFPFCSFCFSIAGCFCIITGVVVLSIIEEMVNDTIFVFGSSFPLSFPKLIIYTLPLSSLPSTAVPFFQLKSTFSAVCALFSAASLLGAANVTGTFTSFFAVINFIGILMVMSTLQVVPFHKHKNPLPVQFI